MHERKTVLNRGQLAILAAATALLIAMLLFPPYYVMYKRPADGLHDNYGRCPIWNPPSKADAHEHLRGVLPVDAEPGRDDEALLADFTVGLNKVRQIFDLVVVGLIAAVLLVLAGRLGRSKARTDAA